MLTLFNTPHKKLETFTPLTPGRVSLYTCGPTVYDYLTVGNWITYVRWDMLVRTLIADGYNVERVMNITDVGHLVSDEDHGEDKLQKGARREGKTAWDVAKHYTDAFIEGMELLNLLMPEHITKATDYIPQQLALVRTLKQKGYTYEIDDGIYFDTSKFPRYGEFAQLDLNALKAGARVGFNDQKKHASDFALWKFSQADEKRDMEWDTPSDLTGNEPRQGFPGWHLECSAMAMDIFGPTLDIHTGGIDHIPVHHTNEIAQSEAATGQPFVHYWLHGNHLKVDGTRIGKSLGNGYTLHDVIAKGFDPLDYRLFAMQSHYRTESNFSWENLEAARNRLQHWEEVAAYRWQTLKENPQFTELLSSAQQRIREAMNDDLNTPVALQVVDEVFSQLEKEPLAIAEDALTAFLDYLSQGLGIDLSTPDIPSEAKALVEQRETARNQKDWKTSDTLRDELLATYGIVLKDTSNGTVWSYASRPLAEQ